MSVEICEINNIEYLKMCFDESVSFRVYLMISNIER